MNNISDILIPKSEEDILKELRKLSTRDLNEKLKSVMWDGDEKLLKLFINAGADINFVNDFGVPGRKLFWYMQLK